MLKSWDEVTELQPGDVVIFKEYPGWTPLSHIAIYDHDAGGGYGYFYGQNQGGAGGAFNMARLPYAATYPTAFRLKKTQQPKPADKAPEKKPPEWAEAGKLHRLYNPNSGDHLYTVDLEEAQRAYDYGWIYEGAARHRQKRARTFTACTVRRAVCTTTP